MSNGALTVHFQMNEIKIDTGQTAFIFLTDFLKSP